MPDLDLAVVVVTWNSMREIDICLNSLLADLAESGLNSRVIVVDGASTDGTPDHVAQKYPQLGLIVSPDNIGFGRCNNLGLKHAGFESADAPRAAYMINPDTQTHPGATRALFDTLMSDEKIGLVGAQLTYGDGTFQHAAFHFPGLRQMYAEFFATPGRFIEGGFNGRYPRRLYEAGEPFKVDCVLGATMMIRREVIASTGMFDAQFFMYCEEIDWAWRIHDAGWEARCVPAAHVTHFGGQSTQQVKPRAIVNLWASRIQLFFKYYPTWKLAIASRMLAEGMRRKIKRERDPEVRTAYETVRQMAKGLR
ncbi:MAG: glycosyltransferase family 2 protein [Chloroflexi bacterium]|nr:glycosyltransferase family 2 protein [Chloroflexota bacterium]